MPIERDRASGSAPRRRARLPRIASRSRRAGPAAPCETCSPRSRRGRRPRAKPIASATWHHLRVLGTVSNDVRSSPRSRNPWGERSRKATFVIKLSWRARDAGRASFDAPRRPKTRLGPASRMASSAFRRPAAASSDRTPKRATGGWRHGLVFWQFWQWVPGAFLWGWRAAASAWGPGRGCASVSLRGPAKTPRRLRGVWSSAAQTPNQLDRFRREAVVAESRQWGEAAINSNSRGRAELSRADSLCSMSTNECVRGGCGDFPIAFVAVDEQQRHSSLE
jgi:hypothetical protein